MRTWAGFHQWRTEGRKARCIQPGPDRKRVDYTFHNKSTTRSRRLQDRLGTFTGSAHTGSAACQCRGLVCGCAANRLSAEGGTLWSAALVDALQSDRSTGDLKKSTFRDFQRLAGYFFFLPGQTTSQQQTNRSITMTNPVYWAVLLGMTVLLMEQGKWWLVFSWEHLLSLLSVTSPSGSGHSVCLRLTWGCFPCKPQLKCSD